MTGFIRQLDELAATTHVEDIADYVIIGSGAAGATAARVLAEAGADVIVVEEGIRQPEEALRRDAYTGMRAVWRDMGFQVAEGRAFTAVLQGRCVGGSTAINGAIIHRTPEKIHAHWREKHGAGELFAYSELSRIWDTLDEELGVAPAPEEALGRNNKLMREGCRALGIDGNVIERNVRGCCASARCLQGCPTSRRQSMNVSYIPRAVRAGARVYATCRADRVIEEGGRATAVSARFRDPLTRREGPGATFRARRAVLLGASAIQTPMLLQTSGVGRRSKLVGQRLQAHPGSGVIGLYDEPVELWRGATQGFESTHYWDERMKMETVAMPLEMLAARFPGFGRDFARRVAELGHAAHWGVQVRARAHGRVKRGLTGRTVIRFDMTDEDCRTMKTGLRKVAELHFAAGARSVMTGVYGLPEELTSPDQLPLFDELPDDPRIFKMIAAHLFGTAVMGPDPQRAVVDPYGQCHELPGLYVIDSSIFPTNMGVNPQHSICAVSWRIAEHLLDTGSDAE